MGEAGLRRAGQLVLHLTSTCDGTKNPAAARMAPVASIPISRPAIGKGELFASHRDAKAFIDPSPPTLKPPQILERLLEIRKNMIAFEREHLPRFATHADNHSSAANLLHYLVLRKIDMREIQFALAEIGLSSLGRIEIHVLDNIERVIFALALLTQSHPPITQGSSRLSFTSGLAKMSENATRLFGSPPSCRAVRIMVTLPGNMPTHEIEELMLAGMNCVRINCAHYTPEHWLRLINDVRTLEKKMDRKCAVCVDLEGPKLRISHVPSRPGIIRVRPERDERGKTVASALVTLSPVEEDVKRAGQVVDGKTIIPIRGYLTGLWRGSVLEMVDARDKRRKFAVQSLSDAGQVTVEISSTVYFTEGLRLEGRHVSESSDVRIGALPPAPGRIPIKLGAVISLLRTSASASSLIGSKKMKGAPTQIALDTPQVLDYVKLGDPILFDDGKIEGTVESITPDVVAVKIHHLVRAKGKLQSDNGVNFPETPLPLDAITADDMTNLKLLAKHVDAFSISFVKAPEEVARVQKALEEVGCSHVGIILKIETKQAFARLPTLLLAALKSRNVGVMIARGDLAVEAGYRRLAEIQEEILWLSEAAHVPCVWATQVLEGLNKLGIPTRAEVTDAAMSNRAECVMLNKGKYIVNTVKVLDDILKRMAQHQQKKMHLLRALHVAQDASA